MRLTLLLIGLGWNAVIPTPLPAQGESIPAPAESVQFRSGDGILIHADLHRSNGGTAGPVIVLFHQAGSNARGEYREIIPRLLAHGFSALAVDLRLGGSLHGGENRTARSAGLPDSREYCSVYPDVVAAWQYILDRGFTGPRFAWGSSYSAALVIRLASERAGEMNGVLAFSPATGDPMEGCRPERYLGALPVPALILRPETEAGLETVTKQLEAFRSAGKQVHVARPGAHGSSMLSPSRVEAGTDSTWNVVLEFLRSHS